MPSSVSLIRQNSFAAERDRRLAAEVMDIIYRDKLFKLFVPDTLGGCMTSLPDSVRIFEDASYIDGSFGWAITIGSGGGYFSSIFRPDISPKLFSTTNALVAGSGHVSGVAKIVDGGYLVSGSWRYCSGADYATIFTANCSIEGSSEVVSFIFTQDQVLVTRDWDAYGLKGTGSHTISVEEVFVPLGMTFDIATGIRHYSDPIFAYPFLPFAQVSFAAVNIGITRHFIDEAIAAIGAYGYAESKRYDFINALITKQRDKLREAITQFYEALDQSWQSFINDRTLPEMFFEPLTKAAKDVTTQSLLTAQTIYPYLGLSIAMEHTVLNQCWRDLHTASQHILLKSFD